MSWKSAGKLVSGPPSANLAASSRNESTDAQAGSSSSTRLDQRFRPNLGGRTAWQREREMASRYGDYGRDQPDNRKSEWDVLKENHRFIRDDEEPGDVSWEERLARAYESKLFKEFALIDLKHYKTRRLALRWRTAPEVIEGLGEDTCASLRCKYHHHIGPSRSASPERVRFPHDTDRSRRRHEDDWSDGSDERSRRREKRRRRRTMPALRAFELPFTYEEAGERKEALVKVKLCPKCQAKLTWKPGKADADSEDDGAVERSAERQADKRGREDSDARDRRRSAGEMERSARRASKGGDDRSSRRQSSRRDSRSPAGRSRSRD